ncbi:putative membrane protein [Streptomyces scabiei 87.22]|uniref:Putative membrane protein n=3 Tax=Streptomyces TaxID=1883 RepID=C9Z159_STRSW|nr:putative membrane protein [Streptomyces scabiei 87.22]
MAERRKSVKAKSAACFTFDSYPHPPLHRERHGETPPEDTIAMPRPTTAQLAYGSCTVILSTLAMLLLSQTSSGVGIAVIALAALALGLLVSLTVPTPKPASGAAVRRARAAAAPAPVPVAARAEAVREPVHEPTGS